MECEQGHEKRLIPIRVGYGYGLSHWGLSSVLVNQALGGLEISAPGQESGTSLALILALKSIRSAILAYERAKVGDRSLVELMGTAEGPIAWEAPEGVRRILPKYGRSWKRSWS